MVVEEKRVITERRHRDADLRQVIQVLQHGNFSEQQTVRDIFCHHVAAYEMLNRSGFAAVRSQDERIQTLFSVDEFYITRERYELSN